MFSDNKLNSKFKQIKIHVVLHVILHRP